MIDFYNKKILMFAPKYFGYELKIKNKLESKGAKVFYYDERCNPTTFDKIVIRVHLNTIISRKIRNYYEKIISLYENNYFDYVVFFNPETITVDILKELKNKQKSAKFILYMWDSFENKPYTVTLLSQFDKKLTFNKNDSKQHNMLFRPLFYIDEYNVDTFPENEKYIEIEYMIGFIGTIHSDRYNVLIEMQDQLAKKNMKTFYYMFFPSKLLFLKFNLKRFPKIKKSEFKFISIDYLEVREDLMKCNAIVDIQHPKQDGLTIRTLETLGLKKKLITTNEDIKNYDFYNEDNVLIINRKNPKIDFSFFKKKYNSKTDKYRKKYSLEYFLNDIFC